MYHNTTHSQVKVVGCVGVGAAWKFDPVNTTSLRFVRSLGHGLSVSVCPMMVTTPGDELADIVTEQPSRMSCCRQAQPSAWRSSQPSEPNKKLYAPASSEKAKK